MVCLIFCVYCEIYKKLFIFILCSFSGGYFLLVLGYFLLKNEYILIYSKDDSNSV